MGGGLTARQPNDHVSDLVSVCFVVAGIGIAVFAATIDAALWLILVRKVLVAFGAAIAALGGIVGYGGRLRSLSPRRAWWVPVAVTVGLGALLAVDLGRIGFGDWRVVLKPTQGMIVAGAFGVPLGSALRRGEYRNAVIASVSGIGSYLGIAWLYVDFSLPLLFALRGAGSIVGVVLLGIPSTVVGYGLTAPE